MKCALVYVALGALAVGSMAGCAASPPPPPVAAPVSLTSATLPGESPLAPAPWDDDGEQAAPVVRTWGGTGGTVDAARSQP
jgi:hypothetical protein